jgi:phospholipase C
MFIKVHAGFGKWQVVCIFSAALFLTGFAAAAPCVLNATNPSVTICTPENGLPALSPVRVRAGTTDTNPVTLMQILVDGLLIHQVSGGAVDTGVNLSKGTHQIQVKAKDAAGLIFSQSVSINVIGSSPLCSLDAASPSVTICTPPNGGTMTSPLHVVAAAKSTNSITQMQISVDGRRIYSISRKQIDTYVTLSAGAHQLQVQARDSTGAIFSKTIAVTIGDLSKIRHIIFFMQENRSFDNYFGRMGQYRRDRGFTDPFDALPLNVALKDRAGHLVSPYHFRTVCHENLSPSWNESHYDVHGGLMDRFMLTTGSVPSTIDPDGTRAMGYYDWTDLPYYYELALQFATSDRFFSSVLSNTIPNRMCLFAATSFGHIRPDSPPSGGWTQPTIFDKLDAAGVSWRYYYQDNSVYLAQWSTWQRDAGKVVNISNWYTNIQNEATLPKVVFIERAGKIGLDEHPLNNIQKGAANTKKILDALMQSPSWASSVFIFTFDEGGGLYDHVVPFPLTKPDSIPPMLRTGDLLGDFNQSGFRVPFIIISPWIRPHYVSHTHRDFGSIHKLIEKRFGVAPLTFRDVSADDLTEFFDFSSPAWLIPPVLPTQPTNGACDFNLENAPGH